MATLGDYISIKHGYAFKGNGITTEDNGIVLVTPGNFAIGGGFKEGKCKFFNDEYPSEFVLSPDDLIVTMTDLSKEIDTLGYSALVPKSNRVYLHNQRIGLIRINRTDLDKHYLYWFMRTRKYQYTIAGRASGTTVHHTSPSRICDVEVEFPDLLTQKKIAGLMDDIEGKIQKNKEINENLTEQARTIFRSWFIDYDSFGGAAPLDWRSSTLGKIADMKTESWSPAKNPDVVVEHYSIPAFDEQHYPVFEIASGIKSNKYILSPESVMISKLNPDTKRIWRPMCLSELPVCSTEFIVYEAKKRGQRDYIYSILDSVPFLNHLCSHTTGSTNSRQRATPKNTLDFALRLPPDSVIENFCQIVTPVYDLIASNIVENQSLANTRNNLLSRLMSGELDVSTLDI